MFATVIIATVRKGFSYERARFQAADWPDAAARIEEWMALISQENPDSIQITLERPK